MVWKKWCCRNNDAQPSQTRPFKSWGFQKNTQLTKKYQAASCSRCAASADFLLTGKPMASANSEARIHLPCLGDHKMFPAWRRLGFACSPRSTSREKLGFEIDQRGILRHEIARCQSLSSTSTCMLPGIHAALAWEDMPNPQSTGSSLCFILALFSASKSSDGEAVKTDATVKDLICVASESHMCW